MCELTACAALPASLPHCIRYRDDLGHAIANFARVVPDGLLVFFPAYSLLTACLDHWKASTGTGGTSCSLLQHALACCCACNCTGS